MDAANQSLGDLTLRAAFDHHLLPKLIDRRRSVATLGNYRQALAVYDRFARDLANELLGPLVGRSIDEWAAPVVEASGREPGRYRLVGSQGSGAITSDAKLLEGAIASAPPTPDSRAPKTGTGSSTTGSQPEAGEDGGDWEATAQQAIARRLAGCQWDRIAAISDTTLKTFSRWMVASGYSAGTHNKHLANLLAILRALGPREKGCPDAAGLLAEVPHCRSLPEPRAKRRLVTEAELQRLYDACAKAQWPADSSAGAPLLWRCYLVLLATHGYRVEDGRSLRWENICWLAASPDPSSIAECPHGWISFTSGKTRREQVLPMNASLRAHLDALAARSRCAPADLVIDMRGRKKTRCEAWSYLQAIAGVECALSDLRKTANNAHRRVCARLRLSHLVPKLFLGHAPRGVNEEFYTREDHDMIQSVAGLGWQPKPAAPE